MRTSNPALNEEVLRRAGAASMTGERTMTVQGTVNKTALLFFIASLSASYTWKMLHSSAGAEAALPWVLGGAIGGFVLALIICMAQSWAPLLSPLYAAAEGLFLGGVSALFNQRYPGVAIQAVGVTLGVLCAMLFFYKTRMIQATPGFVTGVMAATAGVGLLYVAAIVLGFFGIPIPFLHDSGPIGIGVSLVIVAIASFNLILDFHLIESGANHGLPKSMEWYCAFGLMVTVVWLYIETLRLLSKLQRRD